MQSHFWVGDKVSNLTFEKGLVISGSPISPKGFSEGKGVGLHSLNPAGLLTHKKLLIFFLPLSRAYLLRKLSILFVSYFFPLKCCHDIVGHGKHHSSTQSKFKIAGELAICIPTWQS